MIFITEKHNIFSQVRKLKKRWYWNEVLDRYSHTLYMRSHGMQPRRSTTKVDLAYLQYNEELKVRMTDSIKLFFLITYEQRASSFKIVAAICHA